MGMTQYILRTVNRELPVMDMDTGEWVNAVECVSFRKQYWLNNAVRNILSDKGLSLDDYYEEYIPLSKGEIRGIIGDAKDCVREKSESFTMDTFNLGLFYSNYDFDWCLEAMRHFNRCMTGRLKASGDYSFFYFVSL